MAVPITLVCGCGLQPIFDRHWPDAYWRHGPYVLIAIDTEAQMDLSIDTSDGLVSLVGPTVFAVGADAHYVVAQQHPSANGVHFDRAVTNYFIVDRSTEPVRGRRDTLQIFGPLSKAEFDQFARTHVLPPFRKTFSVLEWQSTGG
jgi:hypothetical protein